MKDLQMRWTYRIEDVDILLENIPDTYLNRHIRSDCEIFAGMTVYVISRAGQDSCVCISIREARNLCKIMNKRLENID